MMTRGETLKIITIYPRYIIESSSTVADNRLRKPMRRVLTRGIYRSDGATIARKTGVVLAQSNFIQAFDEPNMQYVPWHIWRILGTPAINDIPPQRWRELNIQKIPVYDYNLDILEDTEKILGGYWSVEIGTQLNTIIVDHETDIEIPWGNNTDVTNAERRHFETAATRIPGARRVQEVEDNRRGSPRSRHVLMRA